MKTFVATASAAAALALAAAVPASASIVSVLGTTAPWNPFVVGIDGDAHGGWVREADAVLVRLRVVGLGGDAVGEDGEFGERFF